jgi:hypothetical protein
VVLVVDKVALGARFVSEYFQFRCQDGAPHSSIRLSETLYRAIHKSMKHLKNSQQIDYATDRGNSYVDRKRNSLSFFQGKARAHSCPGLPLEDSSTKYGVQ